MRKLLAHQILIVVASGTMLFVNLGVPKLWDQDEPRNAGCAAEMLAAGDWVVPIFNAQLRTHKPVLLYWFMMTAYSVFGVGEFAARFWSAVLGMGTVLATYHIGRRLFGAEVGLWAGLILAPALMFVVAGRAATPDSLLVFFSTMVLLVYVYGTFQGKGASSNGPAETRPKTEGRFFPSSWPVVVLMYAMMGMAVLAKGPVGLVLPAAVIGMFLLIMRLPAPTDGAAEQGRVAGLLGRVVALGRPFAPLHFLRTCWAMRPITAMAVVLAVALPWYVWVGWRTDGRWLEEFFLTHNLDRAARPMEGHNGPIVYYLVAFLVGFFPWSVFAGPVLIGLVGRIRRRDPWKIGLIFAACWVGVWIGLFSLVQTKLPSYITPVYPAAALLTACFVYHFHRGSAIASAVWPRLAIGSLGLVGIAMLVALPLAARRFLPGDEWLGAIGVIPLSGAVGCFFLLHRGRVRSVTAAFAVTALAFSTILFGFGTVRVSRHQTYHVLLDAISTNSAEPSIASYGCLEPSWVYYAGRPIRRLDPSRPEELDAFLCSGRDAFVITTLSLYEKLRSDLNEDVTVLAETEYFLKPAKLVVIARPTLATPTISTKPSASDSPGVR